MKRDTKTLVLSIGWGITAIFLVAVLILNRTPELQDGKEVVASIDGLEVTAEDLYSELKSQGGYTVLNNLVDTFIANKEVKDKEKSKEYAEATIESYRLSYKQNNMDFDEYIATTGYTLDEIKASLEEEYLINMAAEQHVKNNVTEEEIKKYYDEHIYEELTVRHILVKSTASSSATSDEKKKAEEEALKKANEILTKYKNGEDFSELAKKYSDDTGTKNEGGLYANFNQTNTDSAFFKAANALKDGEVTNTPVKSQYGYHIILKVSNNGKPSLEDSKETILDGIYDSMYKEDSKINEKAWVELREKYNFQIFDSKLNTTYKAMANSIKNEDKKS